MRTKHPTIREALAPVLRVSSARAAVAWYQRLGFVFEVEHSSGPEFSETTALVKRGELALRDPDGNRIRVVADPRITFNRSC